MGSRGYKFTSSFLISALVFLIQGCSQSPLPGLEDFNPGQNQNFITPHNGGDGDGGFIPGKPGDGGGVVARIKPAMAIRATGCIMCHGQVQANIVTDFGIGSTYAFGTGAPGLSAF